MDEGFGSSEQFAGSKCYSPQWYKTLEYNLTVPADLSSFKGWYSLLVPYEIRNASGQLSQDKLFPLPLFKSDGSADVENMEIFREIVFRRLWPTYKDAFIGSVLLPSGEAENLELRKVYFEFWTSSLIPLLINTWNKYAQLIKIYKEKEGDLLDRVKSSSHSLNTFNDTPQSAADSDLWDDMDHTTTSAKNAQEGDSDFATPMERLDEIRRKLEDIYSDWTLELGRAFIRGPML